MGPPNVYLDYETMQVTPTPAALSSPLLTPTPTMQGLLATITEDSQDGLGTVQQGGGVSLGHGVTVSRSRLPSEISRSPIAPRSRNQPGNGTKARSPIKAFAGAGGAPAGPFVFGGFNLGAASSGTPAAPAGRANIGFAPANVLIPRSKKKQRKSADDAGSLPQAAEGAEGEASSTTNDPATNAIAQVDPARLEAFLDNLHRPG